MAPITPGTRSEPQPGGQGLVCFGPDLFFSSDNSCHSAPPPCPKHVVPGYEIVYHHSNPGSQLLPTLQTQLRRHCHHLLCEDFESAPVTSIRAHAALDIGSPWRAGARSNPSVSPASPGTGPTPGRPQKLCAGKDLSELPAGPHLLSQHTLPHPLPLSPPSRPSMPS